jgi:hypothetical protein
MIPDDKTKHAFDGWFHAYFDNLHGRPGSGGCTVWGPFWQHCREVSFYHAVRNAESLPDRQPEHLRLPDQEEEVFTEFFKSQQDLRPNCQYPRKSMRTAFRAGLSYSKWRIRTAPHND